MSPLVIRKYKLSDFKEVQTIFYHGTSGVFYSAIWDLWNGTHVATQNLHFSVLLISALISLSTCLITGVLLWFTFEAIVVFAIYDIFVERARY